VNDVIAFQGDEDWTMDGFWYGLSGDKDEVIMLEWRPITVDAG